MSGKINWLMQRSPCHPLAMHALTPVGLMGSVAIHPGLGGLRDQPMRSYPATSMPLLFAYWVRFAMSAMYLLRTT